MKIPFNHQNHLFRPLDLPPIPSATGKSYAPHACINCGLSGAVDAGGQFFHVSPHKKPSDIVIQHCTSLIVAVPVPQIIGSIIPHVRRRTRQSRPAQV